MSFRRIEADDAALTWEGAASLEIGEGYVRPWRILYEQRSLYPAALRDGAGGMSSGVRLRFASTTQGLRLHLLPYPEPRKFDLLADGGLVGTAVVPAGGATAEWSGLDAGEKTLEVYLSARVSAVTGLEIDRDASFGKSLDKRPRFVAYGSSITHCSGAHSPSQTWPALVARAWNCHLTSLGFGGQCHVDTLIALQLKKMDIDFLTCSFGINVYGGNSLNDRTFQPAVIGFVRIVREAHPAIPFVVCSPILSPPRETVPNAVGMTLVKMRSQVEQAVALLREAGDENLYYVNGLEIFGEAEREFLPDDLHPNGDGYRRYAENFLRVFGRTVPDRSGGGRG